MLKKQGFSILILSCLLLAITACATGASDSANYPLTSVYTAVERTLSMGIQGYSPNHREITSRPFLIKQNAEAQKLGFHERGIAKVVILGDQRPYEITVDVIIQRANKKAQKSELNNDDYSYERHDQRLAKKLLGGIISFLDKREREKNLIDDFRPF